MFFPNPVFPAPVTFAKFPPPMLEVLISAAPPDIFGWYRVILWLESITKVGSLLNSSVESFQIATWLAVIVPVFVTSPPEASIHCEPETVEDKTWPTVPVLSSVSYIDWETCSEPVIKISFSIPIFPMGLISNTSIPLLLINNSSVLLSYLIHALKVVSPRYKLALFVVPEEIKTLASPLLFISRG